MVGCVDDETDPPPELVIAWQCKKWNTLPEQGGYFDQDFVLLQRMSAVSNIYDALNKLRNSHGTAIHRLTENERKILKMLVDLGLIFNG